MRTDAPIFSGKQPPKARRGLRALAAAAFAWAALAAPALAPTATHSLNEAPPLKQLGVLTPEEFPLVAEGVRLLYDGYSGRAAEVFDRLRSRLPESPAGELGRVLSPAVRLREDPEDSEARTELEGGLASIEKKARALLEKDPEDPRGLFYVGAAHFFRSQVHRHRRAYWSAVQELRASREYLGEVVARRADAWEAYVGLGGYNYFMDALPAFGKLIRWVLFLPGGGREKGLRQLHLAKDHSVLLGPLARSILLVAYSAYEKQPGRAEALALSLHREFPNNPWFHLNLGYLHLATPGRAEEAVRTFKEVLERARSGHPNYVREITDRARLGLAAAYHRLERGSDLRRTAERLLANPPRRPRYAAPLARLLLGKELARGGDLPGAQAQLQRVQEVEDWGHFDWRARQMGFASGEDIQERAASALRGLQGRSH